MKSKSEQRPTRKRKIPGKYNGYILGKYPVSDKINKDKKEPPKKKIKIDNIELTKKINSEERLYGNGLSKETYISSTLDQGHLVEIKKADLLKKINGSGLFALQNIEKNTCIGEYTGKIYNARKYDKNDNSYAMQVGASKIIDARNKGNFNRYINFSDTQHNVEFKEGRNHHQQVVKVIATRIIKKGEQFLVDYNIHNEDTKKYSFFNPQDNEQSSRDIFELNKINYRLITFDQDYPFLAKKDETFYITNETQIILNDKILKNRQTNQKDIDLLSLKIVNGKIIDFDEADVFTPLMLACYLGQLDNVKWLINKGASVDRQQHHSGNCPLFFALYGYEKTQDKKEYIELIKFLINKVSNLESHDRNEETFLYKAIKILSENDFGKVLKTIKNKVDKDEFKGLLQKGISYCQKNLLTNKERILNTIKSTKKTNNLVFFDEKKSHNDQQSYSAGVEMEI